MFRYFFKPKRLKYQFLGFLVHDVIEHFPVLFQITKYEISVTCCDSTWLNKNIIPYTFPVLFQTATFEISVSWFSSTWRYENMFLYFFKPQRLKYHFLDFLVHDVIEHFPVLFQMTTYEISVTCCSRIWRSRNIFPYFVPVLFQTTTFEISVSCFSSTWHYKNILPYFFKPQSLKYQFLAFLVHDVIDHFSVLFQVLFQTITFEISDTGFSSTWRYKTFSRTFVLVLFQTTTFEISVSWFSSTWRNKTFFRIFSNHNVWNIS